MKIHNPVRAYLRDMDSFFYGGNGWQAGLFEQLKDLNFKQAVWRPDINRNSIWKIVKHTIFWKQYIFSEEEGKPFSSEERRSGNWMSIPEKPDEEKWQSELLLLEMTHKKMKSLIRKKDIELFNTRKEFSNYIREIISHDAYHAGQIGLVRVLQGIKPAKY
ncbi:MAG TPA: DinB family protein [Ignavibacteria bacterium]|nr:DinB family protein [Ignavibacteria bacterium]